MNDSNSDVVVGEESGAISRRAAPLPAVIMSDAWPFYFFVILFLSVSM